VGEKCTAWPPEEEKAERRKMDGGQKLEGLRNSSTFRNRPLKLDPKESERKRRGKQSDVGVKKRDWQERDNS